MIAWLRQTLSLSVVVLAVAGCAHMIENRAIERFSANLQSENLEGLKAATSTEFNQRALRTANAMQDIKILRLPDGKTTIMEVETVDDDHRRVTVQVGEEKREVFYELARDASGKWVVDDVYLKQKKQGVTAFKSITEQLDLLLTVREFIDGWSSGDRPKVLAATAPEFRTALEQLPPVYLAQLTRQVLGDKPPAASTKPQAQLDETTAVVRLPRGTGQIVLSLEKAEDTWQVVDVAVDTRKEEEQIPSVWKQAVAVNVCTEFLSAYARQDKSKLQTLTDPPFYEGSLGVANLKQVLLPAADFSDHQLTIKLQKQRADLLLKGEREIVQIDLQREDAIDLKTPPKFAVSEVTIYELESKQEKRLSALFTAQAMLELYCDALAERDLDHLRHCCTSDFANRVWRRLNPATVQGLPLAQFDNPQLEIREMNFQGALTRVEALQGGAPVTYLLREETGRFYVDDMHWQVPGRPTSVKETLAILVPVQNFAAAVSIGRSPEQQKLVLEMLQQTCSTDFNRLVWQQAEFLPNSGLGADTFLAAPLRSIVQSETEVLIQLGDDRFGATIKLKKEHNRELVDDIVLVGGPEPADRIAMKQALRTLLANGSAIRPGQAIPVVARKPARQIQTAVYEEFADEAPREVLHASDVIDIGPPGSAAPRLAPAPMMTAPDVGAFKPSAPAPIMVSPPKPLSPFAGGSRASSAPPDTLPPQRTR